MWVCYKPWGTGFYVNILCNLGTNDPKCHCCQQPMNDIACPSYQCSVVSHFALTIPMVCNDGSLHSSVSFLWWPWYWTLYVITGPLFIVFGEPVFWPFSSWDFFFFLHTVDFKVFENVFGYQPIPFPLKDEFLSFKIMCTCLPPPLTLCVLCILNPC